MQLTTLNTENNKLHPQIAQMKYFATNKHEVTQIKHEMFFYSCLFVLISGLNLRESE